MVRTRFAPSPTGYLHIGGARTALFAWAYARHHGGTFILRIEDTDVERSTPEATQAILDGMRWLGLDPDEGPFYQMQRMDRYREVIAKMLVEGTAYHCWCTKEELDAMRAEQEALGMKPRYDGRWRPEPGKALPPPPEGVKPVVRFRNPVDGATSWNDTIKGPIAFDNGELDDLIIARSDGTPTYNFCVVVDDWDMRITHVIRGDDHVNNTPRQIHIFEALGAQVPVFAHLPTVLNEQGEKMSKRNGAKAVTQYRDEGYLPDAMVNYLARLGWSHGDDEIFSRAQFLAWFDLDHLGRSAGQFDEAKLRWVNAQHLKAMDDAQLADMVEPFAVKAGVAASQLDERLPRICALFKDRCETLVDLARWIAVFYADAVERNADDYARHVTEAAQPLLDAFAAALQTVEWNKEAIAAAIKDVLKAQGAKMPQLAMPVRVLTMGTAHTPSVDAVLELLGREKILARLKSR